MGSLSLSRSLSTCCVWDNGKAAHRSPLPMWRGWESGAYTSLLLLWMLNIIQRERERERVREREKFHQVPNLWTMTNCMMSTDYYLIILSLETVLSFQPKKETKKREKKSRALAVNNVLIIRKNGSLHHFIWCFVGLELVTLMFSDKVICTYTP
jgi:hypothetical protein